MNVLGIDFEDWFHPELIKQNIKNEKHSPSVINGIDKIDISLEFEEKIDEFMQSRNKWAPKLT